MFPYRMAGERDYEAQRYQPGVEYDSRLYKSTCRIRPDRQNQNTPHSFLVIADSVSEILPPLRRVTSCRRRLTHRLILSQQQPTNHRIQGAKLGGSGQRAACSVQQQPGR